MPESNDIDELLCEYLTLLTSYGQMQQFCSQHLHDQAQTIERLQTQLMQSRARAMLRESQLAWRLPIHVQPATQTGLAPPAFTPHEPAENESLEGRLYEADLVICQTGCISHDDYWRVQDHCRRTGKPCILVDQAALPSAAQGTGQPVVVLRLAGGGRSALPHAMLHAVQD